jgi:hypothetical protein
MNILAHGIFMVYSWYIPCILFIGVTDPGGGGDSGGGGGVAGVFPFSWSCHNDLNLGERWGRGSLPET